MPGLFLGYVGTGTMTVYGIDGEPFARLSESGGGWPSGFARHAVTGRDDPPGNLRARSAVGEGGTGDARRTVSRAHGGRARRRDP